MPFQLADEGGTTALLLLCRAAPALRLCPFFGGAPMPLVGWAALSLALVPALLPAAGFSASSLSAPLPVLAVKEIFLGTVIGVICRMTFSVLESGGALARRALFLSPFSASSDTAARMYTVTGIAALLSVDGHHALLRGFAQSFRCMPLDMLPDPLSGAGADPVVSAFAGAFAAATVMAAPLFGAGLMAEFALVGFSRLLSETIVSVADALRTAAVQLAAIAAFGFAMRTALTLMLTALDQLPGCVP